MYFKLEFHFRHLLFQAFDQTRALKTQAFEDEIKSRIRKVGKGDSEIWISC